MHKKLFVVSLLFFIADIPNLFAQGIVRGSVYDISGKALEGVSVIVTPAYNNTKSIIEYAFTNSHGAFELHVKENYDSVLIQFRLLGYKEKIIEYYFRNRYNLQVIMEEKVMHLDEVVVKGKPINQKGDSIRYLVSSFAKSKDISIGDVLKNMPGFTISDNGTICYEGKPIQKYYIEGLDLLEGNYTVVNKNLPYKAVGAVEVMKNHQPIKILEGVVPNDGTSINLKLKKDVALTGGIHCGGGYKPLLYDVNLTPMVFKKDEQLVFTAQTNNVGKELETQFNLVEVRSGVISGLDLLKTNLVNVTSVPTPSIEKERFLDNSSKFLSVKYLKKLKSETEFKFDINYYRDRTQRFGETNKQYFFADSTLLYSEIIHTNFNENNLKLAGRINQNKSNRYANSSTSFLGRWNSSESSIINNNSNNQSAKQPNYVFSSENDFIFRKGNKFSQLYSNINLLKADQSLKINPGVFSDLFNNNEPYGFTTQDICLNKLKFETFYKFSYNIKPWMLDLKPSFAYEKGSFNSGISKNGELINSDSLKSNKHWSLSVQSIAPALTYQNKSVIFIIESPVGMRYLSENDIGYLSKYRKYNAFIEPKIYLKHKISSEWGITYSLNYYRRFNNPQDNVNGYIIKSYNILSLNRINLSEVDCFQFKGNLLYSNPLKGLSSGIEYGRKYFYKDYLIERNIVGKGIIMLSSKNINNVSIVDNFKIDLTVYLTDYLSSLTFKCDYMKIGEDVLNRGIINRSDIRNFAFSSYLNVAYIENFDFSYKFSFNYLINNYSNVVGVNAKNHSHKISTIYYSAKKSLLGIESEFYQFRESSVNYSQAFFINAFFELKLRDERYLLRFSCNNLLNSTHFRTFSNYSSMFATYSIALRPRSFILMLTMPLVPGRTKNH